MIIHQKVSSQPVRRSRKFMIALLLVIALQVATMIYFGTLKTGFHEDEYYSYFSSNRTTGFFYPDHEWVDTNDLRQEYEVLQGEGFNYPLVKLVQSWDVHPPLYYYVLHTVCSFSPGVFSKWQGITVNLIFFVILMILLAAVTLEVTGGDENLALITAALYGFSPAAVSMVMFIRMYTMQTAAVLASALITLLYYKAARNRVHSGPRKPVFTYAFAAAVITLLGFMTQYFYLIWIFFATITLGGLLIIEDRKAGQNSAGARTGFKDFILYGAGQAAAGVLGILHYPAALSQIFSGYRGKEAQEAFADVTNFGDRISTFVKLTDRYLFNSIGLIVVLVIAASYVYGQYQEKKAVRKLQVPGEVFLLAAPAAGYFIVVAKTALLLGDSSLRYEMPILPLLMLFAVMGLAAALRQKYTLRVAITTAGMLILGISLYNLSQHQVLFLYEDEKEKIATASEYHDKAAVVIYNPETPDNVSRLTDQLLCYDKLYYIDASDTDAIDDPEIADSDVVMVYAADSDTTDQVLGRIAECMNPKETAGNSLPEPAKEGAAIGEKGSLVTEEKLYHKDMWTAFKFERK